MKLTVPVRPPFRLSLTVAALQRRPENPVDVWSVDGRYLRAFDTARGPVTWAVAEEAGGTRLRVELSGDIDDPQRWRSLVARLLGTDIDLGPFYAKAARLPAVAPLVARFRGVKPPRFASLWEAIVNSVVFQQLSLAAAMTMVRRLVLAFSTPVELAGQKLFPFPPAEAVASSSTRDLRTLGLSGTKAGALRTCAQRIVAGVLREEDLEGLADDEIARRLLELPGIGPWTASLILLRGFRRLDVFPGGDVAAARGLDAVAGARGAELVEALGDHRGMLYFHLLLNSLAARGIGPLAAA
jgi:DNA-3-methyladenine glycosylase II